VRAKTYHVEWPRAFLPERRFFNVNKGRFAGDPKVSQSLGFVDVLLFLCICALPPFCFLST
jgi:hypothetical protein